MPVWVRFDQPSPSCSARFDRFSFCEPSLIHQYHLLSKTPTTPSLHCSIQPASSITSPKFHHRSPFYHQIASHHLPLASTTSSQLPPVPNISTFFLPLPWHRIIISFSFLDIRGATAYAGK